MITWIAGYPKSGTTWIRLLLSAYGGSPGVNRITVGQSDNNRYFYNSVAPAGLGGMRTAELMALRPAALYHMDKLYDGAVLKTHNANTAYEGIPLIPKALTAKAVCIVRDPRDVAISLAYHFDTGIDEAISILNKKDFAIGNPGEPPHIIGSWSDHVKSWAADSLTVRYEDLCEDPSGVFTQILVALGHKPDAERVKAAVEACEFEKIQAQEQKEGFSEAKGKPFFRSGGSHWRETLTEEQRERIEHDHGEAMEQWGYLSSTIPMKYTKTWAGWFQRPASGLLDAEPQA